MKVSRLLLIALLVSALGYQAFAQAVTTAEIQRLQDNISEISRDLGQVRSRDAAAATRLQKDLDAANDEAVYLKVKLGKQEPVARLDYLELVDKVDRLRAQVRGEVGSRAPAATTPAASPADTKDVPVGTEMDVRLQQPLDSGTAQVEDKFEATTLIDLRQGDRVLIPAGSTLRGVVSSVTKAGRVERKGSMMVAFDRITINGRNYPIRATVTEAIESEGIKAEAGKIGTGAGVGAILGGILGGFKGAMAGILIGGGGTIAATEGKDVSLPTGSVLRVRIDSGLDLR